MVGSFRRGAGEGLGGNVVRTDLVVEGETESMTGFS